MNRAQRRQQERNRKQGRGGIFEIVKEGNDRPVDSESTAGQPIFSAVPLATICRSIQLLIDELRRRGYPLYDFDNKDKSVKQIMILRNKVYFLVEKEEQQHEEV